MIKTTLKEIKTLTQMISLIQKRALNYMMSYHHLEGLLIQRAFMV